MRTRKILPFAGLALVGAMALGAGCPLIPEFKEKVVQLAIGGSTSAIFDTEGDVNTHDDIAVVNIRNEVDLATILDDAGIDVSSVENIRVSGVSYRTVRPDPTAGRQIVDGNVTVQRGTGPVEDLVVNFDEPDVNGATSYRTAPLDPAGVAVLNGVLADLLTELRGGPSAGDVTMTFHVTGQSLPADVATDFEYELKLDFSMVGGVKVTVVQ